MSSDYGGTHSLPVHERESVRTGRHKKTGEDDLQESLVGGPVNPHGHSLKSAHSAYLLRDGDGEGGRIGDMDDLDGEDDSFGDDDDSFGNDRGRDRREGASHMGKRPPAQLVRTYSPYTPRGAFMFIGEKVKAGSIKGSIFNMIIATVGGGMLAIPYGIKTIGLIFGLVLLFFFMLVELFYERFAFNYQ